jgi:dUTP pyrophosphatase
MHILEKQTIEAIEPVETISEFTEEELAQFYEENQEAIDLLGGLDIFESLMNVPDDQFKELEPAFLQVFNEVLNEHDTQTEMLTMMTSPEFNINMIQEDFNRINEAIDTIDFIDEEKKDFLRKITAMSANKMEELSGKATKVVQIPCEVLNGNLPPQYAHDTDAGMDIISPAEYTIAPGETVVIPTGIKCAIPEGYALLIQPRSGQSVKTKLRVANTPGLIDSGYRDEIGVIIENIEPPFKDIDYEFDDNGEIHIKSILHGQSYTIAAGQKFAQMRLVQVPHAQFVAVENVGEIGENRGGGFGSTGM